MLPKRSDFDRRIVLPTYRPFLEIFVPEVLWIRVWRTVEKLKTKIKLQGGYSEGRLSLFQVQKVHRGLVLFSVKKKKHFTDVYASQSLI